MMSKPSIFKKLFPKFLFLSLLGFFSLLALGRIHFKSFYHQESSRHLQEIASVMAPPIVNLILQNDLKSLVKHTEKLAQQSNQRITVILKDGVVISDSNKSPELLDNHKNRPEVLSALKGQVGQSLRYSDSLNEESIYVAIPLYSNNRIIGVLRNSYIISNLTPALNSYTLKVFLGSLVLGVILTFILTYTIKNISSSISKIQTKVQDIADGNFESFISNDPNDSQEISNLINSLNKTARRLGQFFQKIQRQRNEREAILEGMSEGVLSVYMDNNIFHWNKSVCKFFDVPFLDTYKGTPLIEVFRNIQIHDMVEYIKKSEGIVEQEITLSNNRVLQIHGNVLKRPNGEDLCVLMVFTDISTIRSLENHRKEFVGNVSHELRTPLTSISGYIDTLLEGEVSSEETQKKFLHTIKRNSERLNNIIEDLLALSELDLENNYQDSDFEKKSAKELIKDSMAYCDLAAKNKNIQIKLEVSDEHDLYVNIRLMQQAISNLIDNAIKYSSDGSIVNIQCKADLHQNISRIEIIDNGPGIPVEHQNRLFERFYSADKARSRELGGSGLGLSIVKNIVLAHRGSVQVKSEVGKGSVFSITLPINL